MRKRTYVPLLIALAVLTALGIALYLRAKAPPEAARLLPESDAILFLHLKDVRSATHFDQTPVTRSPDFQRFIDATGIVPERDLDSVALALHRMPDPRGPNGPVAYSEVFIGHFDALRLASYLASISTTQESYAGHTIYTVPMEGRQLRIAQVAYDTIAASNMPTPEQVHSILDRARAAALPTPGSSLLAARFHEVPLLSQAWGIGHIGLPFAAEGQAGNPPGSITVMGMQLPLPADTDFVASVRYSGTAHMLSGGAVELRIQEIAPDPASAHNTVETLTTVLNLIRSIGNAQPPRSAPDAAARAIIDSIRFSEREDRATLHATATLDQLKALTTAHNPANATPTPPPASK